jgi:hypothetical protein
VAQAGRAVGGKGHLIFLYSTNAVIVWNTVYMAEAVAQLKREGYPVDESDLAYLAEPV